MIDHMDIESTILHKDSEEAKRQIKEFQESEEGINAIKIQILLFKFIKFDHTCCFKHQYKKN